MSALQWKIHNPASKKWVVVTKELPGARWLDVLPAVDCRVEVCISPATLSALEMRDAMDGCCDGLIGQLTESWDAERFASLKEVGGAVYSNDAVGF
jgi:glycerate dehydrogenase